MKWLTINPAKALGIDKVTGSLEAGQERRRRDLVGDPFSVYARAERVFIDGALVYDRTDPKRAAAPRLRHRHRSRREVRDEARRRLPHRSSVAGVCSGAGVRAVRTPAAQPATAARPARAVPRSGVPCPAGSGETVAIINGAGPAGVGPALERGTVVIRAEDRRGRRERRGRRPARESSTPPARWSRQAGSNRRRRSASSRSRLAPKAPPISRRPTRA